MDAERFYTHSLRNISRGSAVTRILAASIQAVAPGEAIQNHLNLSENLLIAGDHEYNLEKIKRVLVISIGKAGYPMMIAALNLLKERLSGGVLITKDGYIPETELSEGVQSEKINIFEAGHPMPDQRGVRATQHLIKLISNTREDDLVLCLTSGGGSALMVSPVPGVNLEDLQRTTSALLPCGANINEINSLRKHLEQLKGGRLAQLAAPARIINLILSDVVGDPLDVIASGPTTADTTTFTDAYQVLEKHQLLDEVPSSVIEHIHKGMEGKIGETPKPGDPVLDRVQNLIIGNNYQAANAGLVQCQEVGFHATLLTTSLEGEARRIGPLLSSILRQINSTGDPLPRPACIICGGETTVNLKGSGSGGRNQELALSAVESIANLQDVALVTLATDGGDGPTDAAGAVVTGESLQRAKGCGLDPNQYLENNDSYHFFEKLDDLLKTGPTMTNVNDLTFLFAF